MFLLVLGMLMLLECFLGSRFTLRHTQAPPERAKCRNVFLKRTYFEAARSPRVPGKHVTSLAEITSREVVFDRARLSPLTTSWVASGNSLPSLNLNFIICKRGNQVLASWGGCEDGVNHVCKCPIKMAVRSRPNSSPSSSPSAETGPSRLCYSLAWPRLWSQGPFLPTLTPRPLPRRLKPPSTSCQLLVPSLDLSLWTS